MAQKTKKQHYVPRCYLEAWKIANGYQVYVYDKIQSSVRKNSINDIASENYFYDVKPKDVFSEGFLQKMRENDVPFDEDKISQGIEHAFANEVEGNFSKLLHEVLDQVNELTPWTINNCFFISESKKAEFAVYLAIQYIRTKRIRKNIEDTADCLGQWLKDVGASESTLKEYAISKGESKNIHTKMLFDYKNLSDLTLSFFSLTWMLGINKTKKKLYTSDNPIGTNGHIKHPFMSMSGLRSKGVEVFFPISPDCILIMVDGSYHSNVLPLERRFVLIEDEENINYYNSLCALLCERCIFSFDGEMSIIDEMKKSDPGVFDQPSTQLIWGDTKYYPTNK